MTVYSCPYLVWAVYYHKTSSDDSLLDLVWAMYCHKTSSDDSLIHNFCGSWCPYLKSKQANELHQFEHTANLPVCVMDASKPIFKDLANTHLLRRCLDGYTQNSNEMSTTQSGNTAPPDSMVSQ